MVSRAGRRGVLCLAAGALLPVAGRSTAAEEWRTDQLRTGLFLVVGGGANTLVRLTPRGLILVDAKREEDFKPLMAQIRRVNRLADLPLRLLVLTCGEGSHGGAAARFMAAGVSVMAPSLLASQLATASSAPAPAAGGQKPGGALVGFDGRREIELGGARLTLLNVGPARGAADAVAHFPDLQVTAVGSLYAAGEPRSLLREGGSLAAWAAALDQVLRLEIGLVVPAEGPPVGRTELLAFRARLASGA